MCSAVKPVLGRCKVSIDNLQIGSDIRVNSLDLRDVSRRGVLNLVKSALLLNNVLVDILERRLQSGNERIESCLDF